MALSKPCSTLKGHVVQLLRALSACTGADLASRIELKNMLLCRLGAGQHDPLLAHPQGVRLAARAC